MHLCGSLPFAVFGLEGNQRWKRRRRLIFWSCSKKYFQWIFLVICVDAETVFFFLTRPRREHSIPQHLCKLEAFWKCNQRSESIYSIAFCWCLKLRYLSEGMLHISAETNWFLSFSVCFSNQLPSSFIIFILCVVVAVVVFFLRWSFTFSPTANSQFDLNGFGRNILYRHCQ